MQGKLKLSGNMALGKMKLPCALSGAAMKLDQVMKSARPANQTSSQENFKSAVIFDQIREGLKSNTDVAKSVNGSQRSPAVL